MEATTGTHALPPARGAKAAQQRVADAAELFRALAAPVRLQIIGLLVAGEQRVAELQARIGTSQPNLSAHLRTLHHARILERRRRGASVYYRLSAGRPGEDCRRLFAQFVARRDAGGEAAAPPRQSAIRRGDAADARASGA
jgi:ArsR family transcriptional regulator